MSAWRIHATKDVQDDARRVSREHKDVVTSSMRIMQMAKISSAARAGTLNTSCSRKTPQMTFHSGNKYHEEASTSSKEMKIRQTAGMCHFKCVV